MKVADLHVRNASDIVNITKVVKEKGSDFDVRKLDVISDQRAFHAKMGLMLCIKSTLDYLEVNEALLEDRNDKLSKYELSKNTRSQKELNQLYNSTYRDLTKGQQPEYVSVVNNEMEQHNNLLTSLFDLDFEDRKRVEGLINKLRKAKQFQS